MILLASAVLSLAGCGSEKGSSAQQSDSSTGTMQTSSGGVLIADSGNEGDAVMYSDKEDIGSSSAVSSDNSSGELTQAASETTAKSSSQSGSVTASQKDSSPAAEKSTNASSAEISIGVTELADDDKTAAVKSSGGMVPATAKRPPRKRI